MSIPGTIIKTKAAAEEPSLTSHDQEQWPTKKGCTFPRVFDFQIPGIQNGSTLRCYKNIIKRKNPKKLSLK